MHQRTPPYAWLRQNMQFRNVTGSQTFEAGGVRRPNTRGKARPTAMRNSTVGYEGSAIPMATAPSAGASTYTDLAASGAGWPKVASGTTCVGGLA
jgi:hypothetical protein